MKLIYVAGKYRGKTINETYENIQVARQASTELWQKGYAVLCPHTNTSFMDGLVPDDTFLQGTMEILRRCDAIYLLPNWKQSEGARAEFALADELGLEVIFAGR